MFFSQLKINEISICSRVCKNWKKFSEETVLWQLIGQKTCGMHFIKTLKKDIPIKTQVKLYLLNDTYLHARNIQLLIETIKKTSLSSTCISHAKGKSYYEEAKIKLKSPALGEMLQALFCCCYVDSNMQVFCTPKESETTTTLHCQLFIENNKILAEQTKQMVCSQFPKKINQMLLAICQGWEKQESIPATPHLSSFIKQHPACIQLKQSVSSSQIRARMVILEKIAKLEGLIGESFEHSQLYIHLPIVNADTTLCLTGVPKAIDQLFQSVRSILWMDASKY